MLVTEKELLPDNTSVKWINFNKKKRCRILGFLWIYIEKENLHAY